MRAGPFFVFQCPNCEKQLYREGKQGTDKNGQVLFSDGYLYTPRFAEVPRLTTCHGCNTVFWLDKLNPIRKFDNVKSKNDEWQKLQRADFPDVDHYQAALAAGLAKDREDLRYIRLRMWWKFNDRIRNLYNKPVTEKDIFKKETDEALWKENNAELLQLLSDDDPKQQLQKAELYRNGEDYAACKEILSRVDDEDFAVAKERQLRECDARNKWVVKISGAY